MRHIFFHHNFFWQHGSCEGYIDQKIIRLLNAEVIVRWRSTIYINTHTLQFFSFHFSDCLQKQNFCYAMEMVTEIPLVNACWCNAVGINLTIESPQVKKVIEAIAVVHRITACWCHLSQDLCQHHLFYFVIVSFLLFKMF